MPITFTNANYQRKHDASRIVAESGQEPLKNAIACALRLRSSAEFLEKAIEFADRPETKAQLTMALTKAIPDEFHAWIKVAEFIYAKPRHMTVEGTVTLEQILAGTWDKAGATDAQAIDPPATGNA